MRRLPGVVIGTVKSLEDPAGEGRIELEFPWLAESHRSAWAPVATPLAGGERGMFFMPELGDEVLVSFEQGDFDHPFIVGFLWNGKDKPPDQDIDPSVRRLRTVSGHQLDFDDRAGQERVHLKTQGGHEIELKDPLPASVRIKTIGGQEAAFNDQPPTVTLKTVGGNQIQITDTPPGVSISTSTGVMISATPTGVSVSAPTGMVTTHCMQATVNAAALLSFNAPVAQFAGVVQATSVVGAAYAPAPGNTFGA